MWFVMSISSQCLQALLKLISCWVKLVFLFYIFNHDLVLFVVNAYLFGSLIDFYATSESSWLHPWTIIKFSSDFEFVVRGLFINWMVHPNGVLGFSSGGLDLLLSICDVELDRKSRVWTMCGMYISIQELAWHFWKYTFYLVWSDERHMVMTSYLLLMSLIVFRLIKASNICTCIWIPCFFSKWLNQNSEQV